MAAEEIFLRLDGIAGGATAAGHQNEIVVSTYSQAFSNTSSATSTGGAGAGKVKCGEIIVMKNIDKSSPKLIGAVVTGNRIANGDIRFDSTRGNGMLAESYHVALTDVVVTDISANGSYAARRHGTGDSQCATVQVHFHASHEYRRAGHTDYIQCRLQHQCGELKIAGVNAAKA